MNSKCDQHWQASFCCWCAAALVVLGLLQSGCEAPVVQQTQLVEQKTNEESAEAETTELTKQPPSDSAASDPAASDPAVVESDNPDKQDADQHDALEEQPVINDPDDQIDEDQTKPKEQQTIEIPDTWKRLGKDHEIWVDMKNKQVIAAGHIVLRAGPLEMFVCPRQTKEHESVISVNALASEVHAALIAIGATPGTPVQWDPKYVPASGPVIDVTVMWMDGNKFVKRRGQEMIRDFETQKPMEHVWVFGGSQVFKDEETGTTFYYGDGGELICLSNFSTATMDLTIQSSDSNDSLMFEAFTENIPEIATKVYVVLAPQLGKNTEADPAGGGSDSKPESAVK